MVRLRIGNEPDVNAVFESKCTKDYVICKSVKWSASFVTEDEDGEKHPDIRITFAFLRRVLSAAEVGIPITVSLVTSIFRNSILEMPLRCLL